MNRPKVWLLSAYHTDSHASWANWLAKQFEDFEWEIIALPGRHFRWRIRGNPLSWLDALPDRPPDLLIATSMVDLATLRGLRPDLANIPCLYYFHENQFAYPRSAAQHSSIDPQMVQLYGALAADRIAFNSSYNQESFLAGVQALTDKLPDHCPRDLADRLKDKSQIIPVPIEPVQVGEKDARLVLWNHRWEYDKAPEVFAAAIEQLQRQGVEFRLALLGARPREAHPTLRWLHQIVPDTQIVADSYLPKADYHRILGRAGIVVSTAIHEFQGVSMLEAVSAGASPLVPDSLCYPQQYPAVHRYPPGDFEALAKRLRTWLEDSPPCPPTVAAFWSDNLRTEWKAQLQSLLD